MSLRASLSNFDPDKTDRPAVALRVDVSQNESELPVHQHRKGQLVVALRGGVTCEVPGALWMVPPHCGVWIPGGIPHSNRVTANARICFLFVEPNVAALPTDCCTLSITPLMREMIQHLAALPQFYEIDSHTGRLVTVLLDELARMPIEQLHLPISRDPKLRLIAEALTNDPADRSTLAEWATRVAMSERSLARLIVKKTGLTFGRWRQQLNLVIAMRQLSAGASVQQVSGNLGYESTTAFITMFKKSLGKPPGQYFVERAKGG